MNPYEFLPEEESTKADIKRKSVSSCVTKENINKKSKLNINKMEDEPISRDLSSTLTTLLKHLRNEKKLEKASHLLCQLINSELTKDNYALFYSTIKIFFSDLIISNTLHSSQTFRKCYHNILNEINNKSGYLNSYESYQLKTWSIRYNTVYDMILSDDRYDFTRHCNIIYDTIDKIDADSEMLRLDNSIDSKTLTESLDSREDVILFALTESINKYHFEWTRFDIDRLFTKSSEKRLHFQRDKLDDLDKVITLFHSEQRKYISFTKQQNVRTYNSTSHPLSQKNIGKLR